MILRIMRSFLSYGLLKTADSVYEGNEGGLDDVTPQSYNSL